MNPALLNSLRTGAILLAFTVIGTGLLAFTFDRTRGMIEANEAKEKVALINEALPPALYDNDILADAVTLPANPALGTTQPSQAYRARLNGQPSALVLEVTAPDGYSGAIKLLVAIRASGELAGVRVVTHKETPGLGDYIEIAKSAWIRQFDGASLANTADNQWKVKKDGGRFDYMTGATITPRAVVKAVHGALRYYEQEGSRLFTTPATKESP
jgi:electron transport complex protein RnfG